MTEALEVADDFDAGGLSMCEGKAEYAEEATLRSDDEADCAVDECQVCGARAAGFSSHANFAFFHAHFQKAFMNGV